MIYLQWGRLDAQTIGIGIGSLISPFIIMCLVRSYKKINQKEFLGGIIVIALIFSIADLFGFLNVVNFTSIVSLLWLIVRRIYLLVNHEGKKEDKA